MSRAPPDVDDDPGLAEHREITDHRHGRCRDRTEKGAPRARPATVLILRVAATERDAVARGLTDAARSISIAVDREIAGSVTTLRALGASRSLEEGDLQRFREQMARVLVSQREAGWVNVRLASADGQQIVSVREPGGASPDAEPRSFQQTIATGRATIVDLYMIRR